MTSNNLCHVLTFIAILLCLPIIHARCYDPSPAFPLPKYSKDSQTLQKAFASIEKNIHNHSFLEKYPNSYFSVQVTSSKDILWSSYHTAAARNSSRPCADPVDGDTVFRIASITKTFTTLAILYQHAAGNLSLDDPVIKYIPELAEEQNGTLPWKDITLRSMASQLSGIPREAVQSDLINVDEQDPTSLGLPPVSRIGLPQCYEYDGFRTSCNRTQILDILKTQTPLFAPNQKSTYSNMNFVLLGLVLENVTGGIPYSDHIKAAILDPLSMTSTSFTPPPDTHGAIPTGRNHWGIEQGAGRPSGGIYSSASDLSKYLQYILTHYNGLTPALNWANPASWTTGLNSFYGTPWEIFRTSDILHPHSKRPVTFVTKAGGLTQYYSNIIWMPEYDLGVTILVAGEQQEVLEELREMVTVPLVRVAEEVAWEEVERRYGGTFVSSNSSALNTTLTVHVSPTNTKTTSPHKYHHGLTITHFLSNNTNVLTSTLPALLTPEAATHSWHMQLVPTLLFRNETAQKGELWRMLVVIDREDEKEEGGKGCVWDEFCHTDYDVMTYGKLPINEVVFWEREEEAEGKYGTGSGDGKIEKVGLSGFRVELVRQTNHDDNEGNGDNIASENLQNGKTEGDGKGEAGDADATTTTATSIVGKGHMIFQDL